jgi:predicted DNA-binding protein (UPF0251 family)
LPYDPDLLATLPATSTEWLMQRGDQPMEASMEMRLAVQEAIEELDEREQEAVLAVFYERVPYSMLGSRLGCSKPHAWRIAKRAMNKLGRALYRNNNIELRYNMFDNWNEAAASIIYDMDKFLPCGATTMSAMNGLQQSLARHIRDQQEIPIVLFTDIGDEACSQMMHDGTWNADVMLDLLIKKQRDYGHENIMLFGLVGVGVRMCDKIARLKTIVAEGHKPENESLLDTWRDLVGYSVIALMLWNDTFKLNLKEQS